ncbi:MAG: alpha/beta fold hydrolase [Actinomycetota bacterium]|nr:alpha/beta fold hydrolase [Actinomycetota bacterium]
MSDPAGAVPLRSVTSGRGGALLFLHAFGLTPLTYLRTIDLLALSARVIAPWLRPPGGRWSYARVVDSVIATLDAEEVATATVVGHSYGGAVALSVAAAAPARVSELVLVDAMGLSPGRARMARLGLKPSHLRNYTRLAPARDFVSWVAKHPRDAASTAWWAWGCDLVEAADAVRTAAVPRAVLWAEGDSLLPPALGQDLADALDAPFRSVTAGSPEERLDHDWAYRHPRRFADELASELGTLSPATRSGAGAASG